MSVFGHNFVNFKSQEMICWACGFVIWRCSADREMESAVRQLDGTHCGKGWHVRGDRLPKTAEKIK